MTVDVEWKINRKGRMSGGVFGGTYILSIFSKRFRFEQPGQTVTILDDLSDINFFAEPN